MESPVPGRPNRETGLPPGVEVGPLGQRFVAFLINLSVPVVVSILLLLLPPTMSGGLRTTLVVICSAVVIGWVIFVCYLLAARAASPGLRAMKLQVVGFLDGRPIGLARVVIRALVFWALFVTGIGLLIMLIMELRHPRRQGWHDLAATAVMIKERVLAPPVQSTRAAASAPQGPPAQVGNVSPQLQPNGASASMSPSYRGGEAYGSPGGPVPPGRLTPPAGMGYPTGSPSYAPAGAPQGGPDSPYGGNAYAAPYPGAPSGPPQQYEPGGEMYAPGQHGQHADPVAKSSNGSPSAGPPSYEGMQQAPAADFEDQTAVAPPRSEYVQDWSILLDDGRRIALDGLVLLGRNPQPKAGEEDAQLIKIADETRTVSKSHLAVGLDGDGVYVVDRGSTNGSTVSTTNGMSTRCKAGEMVRVGEGAIVSIGDHWLEITRGS
jgi:uncharacterized RDD family membrane protein YckC